MKIWRGIMKKDRKIKISEYIKLFEIGTRDARIEGRFDNKLAEVAALKKRYKASFDLRELGKDGVKVFLGLASVDNLLTRLAAVDELIDIDVDVDVAVHLLKVT
jgi:hypothetical protein